MLQEIRDEAIEWARGKIWMPRLPLLIYFVYISFRYLVDPAYSSILAPLNLGIHELGHVVFSLLGCNIGVAGGTILQLAIPVFGIFNFYRQKDFFAISLAFGWIGVNLFEVARYCADARALALPLVSIFGQETVYHDWEYMLGSLGILHWDIALSWAIRGLGICMAVVCALSGGWLLLKMNPRGVLVKTP